MVNRVKGFGLIQAVLSTIMMPIGYMLWGLATIPGLWLFWEAYDSTQGITRLIACALSLGLGYLFWCIGVLLIMGVLGMIMRPRTEKAQAPTESWLTIRWAFMSLFHRLALPSLQWMVPSFIGSAYYRMMGCKVGKGAQINSASVNDAYMVSIGEKTIIGGSAVINGHLFEKDGIHLAAVKIGSKVVIGTGSQINPGCVVGDRAVIASKAVLPKYTVIPEGEVWGGIPAKCIRKAKDSTLE